MTLIPEGRAERPTAPEPGACHVPNAADFAALGCTFTARFVGDRRRLDGAGETGRDFLVALAVAGRPPATHRMASNVFYNNAKLADWLCEKGGAAMRFPTGRPLDAVRRAIQDAGVPAEELAFAHTGWADIDGAEHYLMPGAAVGPAGPLVLLPEEEPALGGYGFAPLCDADSRRGLALVAGPLLDAMPLGVGLPVVAQAFGAPLHRDLGRRGRALLHLHGPTGTHKTSYARLVQSFYGAAFAGDAPVSGWGSTGNALEAIGFVPKDALWLVDDFKRGTTSPQAVARFVQALGDGTARSRLTRAAELHGGTPVRASVLSTGEDVPEGEASVRARMLGVAVRPGDADLAALAAVQAEAHLLQGVMHRFVAALPQLAEPRARLRARFLDLRAAYLRRPELAGRGINAGRIAENVAANAAVLELVLAWLRAEGAFGPAREAALLATYREEVVPALLAANAESVRSQRVSAVYLEALQELAGSEEWELAAGPLATVAPPRRPLGWVDGPVVCVVADAYQAIRADHPELPGAVTLYRELEDAGLLLPAANGRGTQNRTGLGKQRRVVVLRCEALGLAAGEDGRLLAFPSVPTSASA